MPRNASTPKADPHSNHTAPPILFDLDGTLIDSVYEHVTAWREALERNNIRVASWKLHRRIGMSGKLFFPILLRELGHSLSPSRVRSLEKLRSSLFHKKIPGIALLPGANDLLKFLQASGVRWALATSGDRKQVDRLTRDLAIPGSVPIVTADHIATAKPAPDSFVVAAEKLGVSPSECIVIGDSPWDHLAARRMKALSIGFLSGGYSDDELSQSGACRIYDDPADLLLHVEDLGIQTAV
jgi:HAD superfamily hydrolase (TIGR01509 family)